MILPGMPGTVPIHEQLRLVTSGHANVGRHNFRLSLNGGKSEVDFYHFIGH
jgi:hypothetical protein